MLLLLMNWKEDAIHKLKEFGVKKIITVTVPGAVEIPFAIKNYWEHSKKKKKTRCIHCIGLCDPWRHSTF